MGLGGGRVVVLWEGREGHGFRGRGQGRPPRQTGGQRLQPYGFGANEARAAKGWSGKPEAGPCFASNKGGAAGGGDRGL